MLGSYPRKPQYGVLHPSYVRTYCVRTPYPGGMGALQFGINRSGSAEAHTEHTVHRYEDVYGSTVLGIRWPRISTVCVRALLAELMGRFIE